MFNIGDRVVIKSKSLGKPLQDSRPYKQGKEQGYWFVISKRDNLPLHPKHNGRMVYTVSHNDYEDSGDFFAEEDLLPWVDPNLLPEEWFEI